METPYILPEGCSRAMRYTRDRKHFRMTNFAIIKLNWLSRFYQTSETSIVEAAIHKLYDCQVGNQDIEKEEMPGIMTA
ncbi:hypothetical protein AB4876_05560 [Zhongshania guokunii]|uniref:Uncharacterized protein n=1 Tax=Zhongshania guokunii TaxID=641783 RepID=A0ABV3U5E7_9GAMM